MLFAFRGGEAVLPAECDTEWEPDALEGVEEVVLAELLASAFPAAPALPLALAADEAASFVGVCVVEAREALPEAFAEFCVFVADPAAALFGVA